MEIQVDFDCVTRSLIPEDEYEVETQQPVPLYLQLIQVAHQ